MKRNTLRQDHISRSVGIRQPLCTFTQSGSSVVWRSPDLITGRADYLIYLPDIGQTGQAFVVLSCVKMRSHTVGLITKYCDSMKCYLGLHRFNPINGPRLQ
ncbi:hypothetical protein NP493_748g01000 [Ridgeia piscesae]|uniref:Uncharacterized protein n=1 Tax=Ridgeia piscesae TaxID=27915 RepID=A0AAD9KPH8_RIDPI|nr:hypothetical protein NP493_748g01000 [Ridgeia piscesae]